MNKNHQLKAVATDGKNRLHMEMQHAIHAGHDPMENSVVIIDD